MMEKSSVPIVYHLDHCHSVDTCLKAVDHGYNSVMIDAADLPLEENIKAVKKVVDYAHAKGVHVEAEIGQIKSAGEEGYTVESELAALEDAKRLAEETGVECSCSFHRERAWILSAYAQIRLCTSGKNTRCDSGSAGITRRFRYSERNGTKSDSKRNTESQCRHPDTLYIYKNIRRDNTEYGSRHPHSRYNGSSKNSGKGNTERMDCHMQGRSK